MTALVAMIVKHANALMSANLHNYVIASTLALWWITCLSVLVWPNPIRLDLALYVGGTLATFMGVVATAHTIKTVRGAEGKEPKADE